MVSWLSPPLCPIPLPPLLPILPLLPLLSSPLPFFFIFAVLGIEPMASHKLSEGSMLSGTHSQSVHIDRHRVPDSFPPFPHSLRLPAVQTHCSGSPTFHFPWKASNLVSYSFVILLYVHILPFKIC